MSQRTRMSRRPRPAARPIPDPGQPSRDTSPPNLILIADDPDDGPSVGPRGHGFDGFPPEWGVQAVVVWSGGWDQMVWEEITRGALRYGARMAIVFTRPAHHGDWMRVLGRDMPVLEVTADGRV